MARNDAQHLRARAVHGSDRSLKPAASPLAQMPVKDGPIRQAHSGHHAQRIGATLLWDEAVIAIHAHLVGRHHAPIQMRLRLASERTRARVNRCHIAVFVTDDELLDGLPGRVHLGGDTARVMPDDDRTRGAALDLQPVIAQDARIRSPAQEVQPDARAPPYGLPRIERDGCRILPARQHRLAHLERYAITRDAGGVHLDDEPNVSRNALGGRDYLIVAVLRLEQIVVLHLRVGVIGSGVGFLAARVFGVDALARGGPAAAVGHALTLERWRVDGSE